MAGTPIDIDEKAASAIVCMSPNKLGMVVYSNAQPKGSRQMKPQLKTFTVLLATFPVVANAQQLERQMPQIDCVQLHMLRDNSPPRAPFGIPENSWTKADLNYARTAVDYCNNSGFYNLSRKLKRDQLIGELDRLDRVINQRQDTAARDRARAEMEAQRAAKEREKATADAVAAADRKRVAQEAENAIALLKQKYNASNTDLKFDEYLNIDENAYGNLRDIAREARRLIDQYKDLDSNLAESLYEMEIRIKGNVTNPQKFFSSKRQSNTDLDNCKSNITSYAVPEDILYQRIIFGEYDFYNYRRIGSYLCGVDKAIKNGETGNDFRVSIDPDSRMRFITASAVLIFEKRKINSRGEWMGRDSGAPYVFSEYESTSKAGIVENFIDAHIALKTIFIDEQRANSSLFRTIETLLSGVEK